LKAVIDAGRAKNHPRGEIDLRRLRAVDQAGELPQK
jgi:hypothetical protein